MLVVADTTRVVPTIGAIAASTPRTCSASTPTSPAASRFIAYETGGASTATNAAINRVGIALLLTLASPDFLTLR